MIDCYAIDDICGLDEAVRTEIKEWAHGFFAADTDTLADYINNFIQAVDQELQDKEDQQGFIPAIAVFFDEAFRYLCECRRSKNSELYLFLRVLNHLPVLQSSPFYAQSMDILFRFFRKDMKMIKTFDRLQLMYVFIELGYYEGAGELEQELSLQINSSQLHLYTLFQLCRYRLLSKSDARVQRLDLVLNLIYEVFHSEGPESAIFLMVNWLNSLDWIKHSQLYVGVLYNLHKRIRHESSLNSALAAYELFEMDNRLVSPAMKMELYKHLINFPASILNSRQLRALHFFAGNYQSVNQESFRESILSFKSSNYYLHKCWERLVGISKYIRTHSTPNAFKLSVGYLEQDFLELSHYTSMRNNCYVENLQGNFDQIEELYREMGELSLTDALTGLKNRRYMDINLLQMVAFASRHKTPVCFAMMDIDFFKKVNDRFGHAAGDAVLKKLAEMMKDFRKSDAIIRYGGEEFLLVLFDTGLDSALKLLQTLKHEVAETPFIYEDCEIRITVSIGLTCEMFSSRDHEQELSDFIEHADVALYEAKKTGRDSICIYAPKSKNHA